MVKYNIIKTMEDKADFIAGNMELEYDSIDYDDVILFTCRFDKTIYSVNDHEGYSVFFERYYEADNYLADLIETLNILKDDFDENETYTLRLTKNHISFSETIRGDDIGSSRLEDLFDDYAYDEVETLTKVVLCDGDIKETFVEMIGDE